MKHKRIYISADIEGVAGVVSMDNLGPKGFEYELAREWMTGEVVAACEAAFAQGAEEIVVSDSHGNAQNLLLDRLPRNVQVVRGWPRPLLMMEGVQVGRYDAAFLLGYHPGATSLEGVLAHTLSGNILEVRLNGMVASETVISAATAGHYGVPVALASGDDAYERHVADVLGERVETVVTKWAVESTSMRCLLPSEACDRLSQGAAAALSRLDELQPFVLEPPIEVEVTISKRSIVEKLAFLPNIERLDTYRIRFVAEDMPQVSRFLMFVIM